MKKWQYLKVPGREIQSQKTNEIYIEVLNHLGEKGWELITFTWVNERVAFAYFKKEL